MRRLAIPYEWQPDVIRAAITLKLNAYDDTGAIIAAMTTSIPESANSGRNWDYRYCWLRDGYFVVDALNRLGATATMEGYMRYLATIAANVSVNDPYIDIEADIQVGDMSAVIGDTPVATAIRGDVSVLVLGGSQGARAINAVMPEAVASRPAN